MSARRSPLVVLAVAALVVAAAPPAAGAGTGTWTSDTPTGLARQEVSYVRVGTHLYLAGGRSTVQQSFDVVHHTWRKVAPLPVAWDHVQAAAVNGRVYYVGGLDGYPAGASHGNVYVYAPVSSRVTTAAPLPAGRDRGAGGIVVYQGRIYLAGGFHAGASVAFFDRYDPATNSWKSLPDLPEPRDHVSAAVVNGKMYVIGGRTYGKVFQPANDAFDFATGRWTTGLAPLPTLRSGAATAVFGTEIAVIGGERSGAVFSTVEAYDTATNSWRSLTPMPTARHGIQAATYRGSAYVADGGTRAGGGGATAVQQVLTLS